MNLIHERNFLKIVNELKNDTRLRKNVSEWCLNCDPTRLIDAWIRDYVPIVDRLECLKIEIPDGFDWSIDSCSVDSLVLSYYDNRFGLAKFFHITARPSEDPNADPSETVLYLQ